MTIKYLIDENLPAKIQLWKSAEFIHVTEIKVAMDDFDIWKYAQENQLTIVTKDADFRNMMIADKSDSAPKVILFGIGNMKLNEFIQFVENTWSKVKLASSNNKLVIVYNDFIETF